MNRIIKYVLIFGAVVIVAIVGYQFFNVASNFGPGLSDYEYRIADHCILNRYSAHEINIDCDGINKRIDSEVFQVGWNDTYLIAASHPVTKPAANNPNCKNCEPDEFVTYWWIRDLIDKKAYGPMSQEEFAQEKTKLGIPDIQLMSIDEAKAKGVWLNGDNRSNS